MKSRLKSVILTRIFAVLFTQYLTDVSSEKGTSTPDVKHQLHSPITAHQHDMNKTAKSMNVLSHSGYMMRLIQSGLTDYANITQLILLKNSYGFVKNYSMPQLTQFEFHT